MTSTHCIVPERLNFTQIGQNSLLIILCTSNEDKQSQLVNQFYLLQYSIVLSDDRGHSSFHGVAHVGPTVNQMTQPVYQHLHLAASVHREHGGDAASSRRYGVHHHTCQDLDGVDDLVAGAATCIGDQARRGERQRDETQVSTLGDDSSHAHRHDQVIKRKSTVHEEGADGYQSPSVSRVLCHDISVFLVLDVLPVPFDAFDALANVTLVKYQQIVFHERHGEEAQWADHFDLIVRLFHLHDEEQAAGYEHEAD